MFNLFACGVEMSLSSLEADIYGCLRILSLLVLYLEAKISR
jgi:hypothetical protein